MGDGGDGEEELHRVLSVVLTVLYALLCTTAFFQTARILFYKHKLFSFHFAFLALVFVWTALRLAFFGETGTWPSIVTLLVYWYPVDLQFATFSLLVVFYAYHLYPPHIWVHKKTIVFGLYGLGVISVFLTTSFFVLLSCLKHTCVVQAGFERAHHSYLATQMLVLVVLLPYYGTRLFAERNTVDRRQDFMSNIKLGIITVLVWFIFVSRCVYNCAAMLGEWDIEIGGNKGGIKQVGVIGFALFVLWEVLPTTMVLLFFRHIPTTRVGSIWCCCLDKFEDDNPVRNAEISHPCSPIFRGTSDYRTFAAVRTPSRNHIDSMMSDSESFASSSDFDELDYDVQAMYYHDHQHHYHDHQHHQKKKMQESTHDRQERNITAAQSRVATHESSSSQSISQHTQAQASPSALIDTHDLSTAPLYDSD